jgi:hypothetical protein
LTILASPSNAVAKSCVERLETFKKTNCFGTGSGCDIKETAMAILALEHTGATTTPYEDWLLNKTMTATNIIWYLEQDSTVRTTCEINYDSTDYPFTVQ